MEDFKTIGGRIRQIRTTMGLIRDDFAGLVGVSRNTLARYETDERKPDADFIINFCQTCEVSADWLLFGILPEDQQQQQLSVDEMLLIALCRRHPDEVIHRLRALLTAIALGESEKDVDPSLREE
ncbi:helix-turn-helix domain-containing protein [Acinetobacter brisouii]|uniref:helix-turn-helix domain-containing protein n=1 Tax=Acinetobacter brisouii TaxID=396323 RepID=UPI00148F436D|nr:helix-turn-helix transcriptional regulator [Acinetobacter brisouii]